MNSCVHATDILQLLALLICTFTVITAYCNFDDLVSPIAFQSSARLLVFCIDLFAFCMMMVLRLSHTDPVPSSFVPFLPSHGFASFFDGSSFWSFVAVFAVTCVVLLFIQFCSLPFRPSPRRIFAARRIGGRRFRHSRRRFPAIRSSRFRPCLNLASQFRHCLFWPIRLCLSTVHRPASLGEQADQCLTPASRGCDAGDGPTSSPDVAFQNDAWAKYLNQKSRPSSKTRQSEKAPNKSTGPASVRSRWTDCILDMTQFKEALRQLQPDQFQSNSSGVVLLTRPLFMEAHAVRSNLPLAVILPGQQNKDLIAAGFQESSFESLRLFVQDPLLDRFFRKKVTMVQLGTVPVTPKTPTGETEWSVEDSTEFSIYLTKDIFSKDDWPPYVKECRRAIPEKVRSLHTDLTSENCIFYAWRKLDDGTHRATFRAPTKHRQLLLESSGICGPFFIQVLCRTDEDKKERSSSTTIQWLPRKSYADALVIIRSLAKHQGLVYSKNTFGVRVQITALAAARAAVARNDPRYTDSNRGIVGRSRYEVIGLPRGTLHQDIITHFSQWEDGWHVLPQRQVVTNGGDTIWTVLADTEPPGRYYEAKNARVLVQKVKVTEYTPKPRAPAATRSSTSKPPAERPASSVSAQELRFQEIEKRLSKNEERISQTEERLTKRLDDGFSQILSQLGQLSASALPPSTSQGSQGHKRAEAPQHTPHKGGPRKDSKTENSV